MPTNSKRIPSALKHGIYSGFGLLPTESRAKFRKFRKQVFAELNPVGRIEEDICDEIVRCEWRRQHLATYELAERARTRHKAIRSEIVPEVRYMPELPSLPTFEYLPHPENPSPEELRSAQRRADKKIQIELGAALELVELGEVATLERLEKQVGIRDRLDVMTARLYKKLAYVRAIKTMAPPSLPVPSPLLLENTA